MKPKLLTAAMLAAALSLALTACGAPQAPAAPAPTDAAPRQTEQPTVPQPSATDAVPTDPHSSETEVAVPTEETAASQDEPWKEALAESLFENYGVLPESYEDLGDGIYQVYVEVGGEVVPFVTVDSATGEYHG